MRSTETASRCRQASFCASTLPNWRMVSIRPSVPKHYNVVTGKSGFSIAVDELLLGQVTLISFHSTIRHAVSRSTPDPKAVPVGSIV